jgi:hypothetical protein
MAVFASLAAQTGYAGVADYWLGTHAGEGHTAIGERWDATSDPADYPAMSIWDSTTGAISEFGGGHAYSSSSLADGRYYTYAYADASWFDRVTVYDPDAALGQQLPVFLHFDLSGILDIDESGTVPAGTSTEGRAAVTADVKSNDLGFVAHGYNMWASYNASRGVMRKSGNWNLGGWADAGGWSYIYDNLLVLPLLVPNGVEFDLFAKIAVGTSGQLTYTGTGTFGGLGDYSMTTVADFEHSMILGGFTDAQGNDIRTLGDYVWSEGPTFGGPQVVPEPNGFALLASGLAALAGAGAWRRMR